MEKSIKVACVAGALTMGLLGATTAAMADITYDPSTNTGITYIYPPIYHTKPPIVTAGSSRSAPSDGGSSGGAPSPEVNTLLGFLIVAGTVVFVKRRRGNKAEVENAAV